MSLLQFIGEKIDRLTHRGDADDHGRARGLWGRMSDEQRKKALAYDGEETFGDPDFGR
jgi:hypothetical protein